MRVYFEPKGNETVSVKLARANQWYGLCVALVLGVVMYVR